MQSPKKISAVIPTLNASDRIQGLIVALKGQTIPPNEILVVDSESDDRTVECAKNIEGVRVKVIPRDSFNHGTTRHEALLDTSGEYVCFFTDDAIPANDQLIEELIEPLRDPLVALASGRQLPKNDARRFEQLVREFNYPVKSNVRTVDDIESLGVKAFFATDVCAVYRRSAYLEVGGFPSLNTNEDMYMAATFLRNGYKVAYVAEAEVIHSHNFTPLQQYGRYRDIGIFMESHRDLLSGAQTTGEGFRLVKAVSSRLLAERRLGELIAFGLDSAARLLGNIAGTKLARSKQNEI